MDMRFFDEIEKGCGLRSVLSKNDWNGAPIQYASDIVHLCPTWCQTEASLIL